MFYQQAKEKAKERWSKDAALFDAAADFEWLRGAAMYANVMTNSCRPI